MPKIVKLLVSLLLGLNILLISFGPVNATAVQRLQPIEVPPFPELETCIDCHLEENRRVGLTGTVITVKETTLYLVPIQEDFSINTDSASLKVPILPGMSFEIAHTYKLVDGTSRASSYGLLANTYGGKYLGVLLLSSDATMTTVDYVKKNVRLSPVVTYIAGAQDLYPNKVENILLALKHLSIYQDLRQGFSANQYISVLRAFGFYSYEAFKEYKYGKLASGVSAPAGGVCAAATGLASLAYTTKDAKIVDIVHHDSDHLYFQGPFSPPAEGVDSGISIRPDGSFEELGFTLPEAGYFGVDVQLVPNGVLFEETDSKGLQGLSDVLLIFSVSYNQKPLPKQSEKIKDLISSFQQFRGSAHTNTFLIATQTHLKGIQTSGVMLSNIQRPYTTSNTIPWVP